MPRNGSGTYSLPQPPFQAGTVISSAAMNSDLSDIATALTGSLPRNGEAGMSGQLKLADGSAATPSLTFTTDLTTGFSHSPTTIDVDIAGVTIGSFSATGWSGNVTGQNTIQVGMLFDYVGSSAPSKYILCFGQNVSRTTYATLFALIGTTYGSGDGSTTFGVPDLRGVVIAGLNNMGGVASSRLNSTFYLADPNTAGTVGGGQSQTLTASQIPSITSSGNNSISVTSSTRTLQFNGSAPTTVAAPGTPAAVAYVTALDSTMSSSGSNSIGVTSNNTSGTAHTIVQPSMVLNKIMYVGV